MRASEGGWLPGVIKQKEKELVDMGNNMVMLGGVEYKVTKL